MPESDSLISTFGLGAKPHALGFFLSGGFPHSRNRGWRNAAVFYLLIAHPTTHPPTQLSKNSCRRGWIGARGREKESVCVTGVIPTDLFIIPKPEQTTKQTHTEHIWLVYLGVARDETIPDALLSAHSDSLLERPKHLRSSPLPAYTSLTILSQGHQRARACLDNLSPQPVQHPGRRLLGTTSALLC